PSKAPACALILASASFWKSASFESSFKLWSISILSPYRASFQFDGDGSVSAGAAKAAGAISDNVRALADNIETHLLLIIRFSPSKLIRILLLVKILTRLIIQKNRVYRLFRNPNY